MLRKLHLFSFGVILFTLFVLFSYLVHEDLFIQFDFDMTVRLQNNISRRLDDLFSAFSDIGNFELMLIVLIVLFACVRKFIAGLLALALFAGFHILELFGKFFVTHPPPPHFLLRTKEIIEFPQFHVSAHNSYPSGHAGRTMFLSAILITLIWRSKKLNTLLKLFLTACIVLFDSIMLVSRVYLGEHWATDVIGGVILGASLGTLSSTLLIKKNRN